MSLTHIREHYGVPAEIGRRVTIDGRPGIIAEDRGHYIGVNFDDSKPGVIACCHPTWEVVYGEMGVVRRITNPQRRYLDWLKSDCNLTFIEWLKCKKEEAAR